jgi:hypothetical protein
VRDMEEVGIQVAGCTRDAPKFPHGSSEATILAESLSTLVASLLPPWMDEPDHKGGIDFGQSGDQVAEIRPGARRWQLEEAAIHRHAHADPPSSCPV